MESRTAEQSIQLVREHLESCGITVLCFSPSRVTLRFSNGDKVCIRAGDRWHLMGFEFKTAEERMGRLKSYDLEPIDKLIKS